MRNFAFVTFLAAVSSSALAINLQTETELAVGIHEVDKSPVDFQAARKAVGGNAAAPKKPAAKKAATGSVDSSPINFQAARKAVGGNAAAAKKKPAAAASGGAGNATAAPKKKENMVDKSHISVPGAIAALESGA